MVGQLLRSLWSPAAKKPLSNSSSSPASYLKPLAFARTAGLTRPFSSTTAAATSPSNTNASGSALDPGQLRNVAVMAHVDHGKTILMDWLLRQCGADIPHERALDSSLERKRGITISSKLSLAHFTPQSSLEESIRSAVLDSKTYEKIPNLLNALKESRQNRNPFLFLSTLPKSHRIRVVDDILQSFIHIRPRSQPHVAYSCLLSYTLLSPNPLPLALAIVQCILRSGCLPNPQTHPLLSKAWIDRRQRSQPVSSILLEMHSIGYPTDCGTCNFLILSLCKVNQLEEAKEVLRGMGRAGCVPDLDSFGIFISEMSELRMISGVIEMVKEMVSVHRLNPRKEMIVKAVAAMRANRDIRRAIEMIQFLESNEGNVVVGFEAYELVLEGCLDVCQFVLGGKFVMRMTERGFIPYIRARQRLFEGLVSVGESQLASIVRRRFVELKS